MRIASKLLFPLLVLILAGPAWANQRAQGDCMRGNNVVVTSGLNSTTKVMQSFPLCTVTVFISQTSTLATIYSDNLNTPLSNPFTSDSTGHWFWYAANGHFDVQLSGGGLGSPYTLGDILLADPAAGGVVPPSQNPVSTNSGGQFVAATVQGNGSKVQLASGPFVSGDLLFYDVNGNAIDTGVLAANVNFPTSTGQLQYLRTTPNSGNNVTKQWATLPIINSNDYNFPPQSVSATITGGVNSLITLTPVPFGLNWNDGANDGGNTHQLLVAGGGGPTEVCFIVSAGPGSATSGNPAGGTLTVRCPSTHSTAGTVGSNTSGIQEALYALQGGKVYIPTPAAKTSIPIYGGAANSTAIIIPCNLDWEIYGDGGAANTGNAQSVFTQTTLALALQNAAAPVKLLGTANTCTPSTNIFNLHIHDLAFRGPAIGDGTTFDDAIAIYGYLNTKIRNTAVTNFDRYGIYLNNAYSALIENNVIVNNGQFGIYTTGSLANVTKLTGNSVSTNCRINGSTTCANYQNDANAIVLDIQNNAFQDCGAHPWSGSVTSCTNTIISGILTDLNYTGNYHEVPAGTNPVNLGIQGNVSSGVLSGNYFQSGSLQLNENPISGVRMTIGVNTFNKNGCVAGGCGNAIWIPVDTGTACFLQIDPQELQAGAVHNFGSSFCHEKYTDMLRPGIGSPLASATTITPTNDIHHLTGTGTITTITIPPSFKGSVTLICDSTAQFNTGGNFGRAFTCVGGETVTWTLDDVSGNWYPNH